MKKKITVVFVAILIIFNFIYCNLSFAENRDADETYDKSQLNELTELQNNEGEDIDLKDVAEGMKDDIAAGISTVGDEEAAKSGTAPYKRFDMKKSVKDSYGTSGGVFYSIWAFFIGGLVNNIPQLIVEATGSTVIDDQFTIYDLVIGNYEFFNLNFYDMKKIEGLEKDSIASSIISNIFVFYSRMRNLGMAISLFVLMYIGIRMATSTTAPQKAKYKSMLFAWFTALFLLFFMHYIIIIISYLTQLGLEIAKKLAEAWGVENIEGDIVKGNLKTLKNDSKGFHLFQTLVMVTAFIFYEIKFLIAYIKRYCTMVFLIIISPLVTVTYAIDKIGDNRAQAFATWFKELSTQYAIQVIHAITYIIFIAAAGEIAQTVPLVAIFFLWALGRAEKTIRKVVGLQGAEHVEKAKMPKPPGFLGRLTGRRHRE